MNNDLTGTQNSSPSFLTHADGTSFKQTEIPLKKLDVPQVYHIIDTISGTQIEFVPQLFKSKSDAVYDTSAQHPILAQPEGEKEEGNQPAGVNEQKLIMTFYYQRAKELVEKTSLSTEETQLVYQNLTEGIPLSDPRLAALAKKISDEARSETLKKEARLPKNWNPHSTQPQDWVLQPLKPYNKEQQAEITAFYEQAVAKNLAQYVKDANPALTDTQIEKLNQALSVGKVSSEIAEAFTAITKKATTETQQAYGLAVTWYNGVPPSSDEWTAINLGILTPVALNESQGELILGNIEDLLKNYQDGSNRLTQYFGPQDPNRLSMDEFRKIITKAIRDLKDVLRDIQLKEGEQSRASSIAKQDAITAKQHQYERDKVKQDEIRKKQEKAQKLSSFLKIAGPIVAGLSTIIGGALLIFTVGASASLIVAGISVGLAMTAYSIVDSTTGSTQKLITLVNESLEEAFPDNPLAQKIVKALGVALIVAAFAALIVITGGGAAASSAAQVAKEVTKQLSLQVIIMTIMASNVIPELVGQILERSGVSEDTSKIIEVIMMLVTMLTIMVAMATGGKGVSLKDFFGNISEGVKSAARSVQQFASQAADLLRKFLDEIKQGATQALEATIRALQKVLQQLLTSLSHLGQAIKEFPQTIITGLKASIDQAKKLVEAILNYFIDVGTGFVTMAKGLGQDSVTRLVSIKKFLDMLKELISVTDGINRGVVALQVAKLLEQVADIKENQELIQAVIKTLDKLLANIQTGIDQTSEFNQTLQRAYNSFYDGLSRNTTKIFQTLQG